MSYAVKTLLNLPGMPGSRVGVITYSGGAGIMLSDGLEKYGLQMASFSDATVSQVAKLSPGWMPLGNPLDIWPAVMLHGARKAYTLALKAVMQDPGVDAVICIAIAPLPQFSFLDVSGSLNEVLEAFPAAKPVIVWTYGPNPQEIDKRFESQKRIMTYPTLELAAWSLSLLRERSRIFQRNSK